MAKTSGDLSTYSLVRLLLFAARKGFSGALAFRTEPEVRIYFLEGRPVFVDFVHREDLLGTLAVQGKVADADTVRRALSQQERRRELLGRLLVELGVARERVLALLQVQQRRKLTRLFQLDRGAFQFLDEGVPAAVAPEAAAMAVEPYELAWKVLQKVYDRDRLERETAVLRAGPLLLAGGGDVPGRLTPAQQAALDRLRLGGASLPELLAAGPAREVLQLVYWLWAAGRLDLRPTARLSVDGRPEAERLTSAFRAVSSQPTASQPTGRKPEPKGAPRAAGSPGTGAACGPEAPRGPRGKAREATWTHPPLPPDAPEAAKELYEEIRSRWLASAKQNLFEVLGVPLSATKQQIKEAYLALAKRFHPDRVANLGVEALRDPADALFQRISEAYMTLLDDEQRAEYRRILEDDSLGGDRDRARLVMQAEVDFQKGEVFLRKGDLDQAEIFFKRALEENPDEGEHRAMVAWVQYLKARRAKRESEVLSAVRQELEEAVQMAPRCARIHYFLGKIHQARGDEDAALASFERAVALNKHYLEPAREINIIKLRRAKETKGTRSTFWDRIRRR